MLGPLAAGVIDDCKLPNVDNGNQTQAVGFGDKCSH